jgi:hypothetical protein
LPEFAPRWLNHNPSRETCPLLDGIVKMLERRRLGYTEFLFWREGLLAEAKMGTAWRSSARAVI